MLRIIRVWSRCAAGLALLLVFPIPRIVLGASDPWSKDQVIAPANLDKRLAEKTKAKPLLLYVGFRKLYEQGHIPGSQYAGPAATPEGLSLLKKQVAHLARTREIVLYCGCCPWHECPNIRPAFEALAQMGFTRLRVLSIPENYLADWVNHGYPSEKSP